MDCAKLIKLSYKEYVPPGGVEGTIKALLSSLPLEYTSGLGHVVLTNTSGLSRLEKRRRVASGSRASEVRGMYHRASGGGKPYIEIFIDNTLLGWPRPVLRVPLLRAVALGEVLYHEIAHHVQHATMRYQGFPDLEGSADKVASRLLQAFLRKKYWYLRPVIVLLRCPARFVIRRWE
jgi:hypothetical protein